MSNVIYKHRFLILRRIVQVGLMLLYVGGNIWGWKFLQGNLSTSLLLKQVPLSDPYAVLQMFVAGAIVSSNLIIGALIIAILYLVLGGRVFCSWVCPVNIITDGAAFLRRKLNIDSVSKKQPASRKIRYWVLGLSLVLSYVLAVSAFEFVSPIAITHRAIIFGMGLGWAMMLIVFLFDLLVLKNGWCGHICPLGGFYALVGKVGLVRVAHDESKCTVCMKCKVVCPEMQVLHMVGKSSEQVLFGECTNCGRCIEACDDDALNFSIRKLAKERGNETNN